MKLAALAVGMGMVAFPQSKGTTSQQAKDCAQNFIGNNNTGTITCYNVDKKLAEQIGQLVVASKRDGKTLRDISDKMDMLLRELQNQNNITAITQQAPNGINIGPGAFAPNPQVFNGPPLPHLRFTEEASAPVTAGEKVLMVHVFTDRSIPGAVIGLILSGPGEIDGDAIKLNGASATQFSWGELKHGDTPIPNSVGVSVNIPAAFMPGQELIIPVKSQKDIHVIEARPLIN